MAFVDQLVDNEKTYFKRKKEISEDIQQFVREKNSFENTHIRLNNLDQPGRGINGVYLTVLGTSADGADSGQVGRGNRVNGLISLNRPQCSEAAAGKNPISHVGKIYNHLTFEIANKIHKQVSGTKEIYVWLLSSIGQPIDQPAVAAAQVIPESNASHHQIQKEAEAIIDKELENIDKFCMKLAHGEFPIC
jgi:S-adenosylmethionine synthetase